MKISTSNRSPLSPTRWSPKAFVWWRSLLLIAAIVVSAIAVTIVYLVIVMTTSGQVAATHPTPALTLIAQSALYVPLLALMLLVLPRLACRSLADLGLRVPSGRDLAWGIGGALGMIIVIQALGAIEEHLLHLKISETAVDLLKSAHGTFALVFALFACIVAPFVEEFVFRGFLLNAFLRYVPAAWAIGASAMLFGLAHFDRNSLSAVAPLVGGGAVLGYVYYRTGALTASMISHGCFNAVSVIGLFVFKVS